jgi:hypothetical protein
MELGSALVLLPELASELLLESASLLADSKTELVAQL